MGWSYSKPPGWTATTKRILRRDARQCYRHGPNCITTATHVDHVIPRSQGGTDEDSNLAAICTPCHAEKTRAEIAAGRARRKRPSKPHPGLI